MDDLRQILRIIYADRNSTKNDGQNVNGPKDRPILQTVWMHRCADSSKLVTVTLQNFENMWQANDEFQTLNVHSFLPLSLIFLIVHFRRTVHMIAKKSWLWTHINFKKIIDETLTVEAQLQKVLKNIFQMISAEYMFLYIGRYKTLHISCQYKPQA